MMKEKEHKKDSVRVIEGNREAPEELSPESPTNKLEKFKKPLIFGLMGIVFIGCLYLIFKPSADKQEIESRGLNEVIPQASGAELPRDKGKAYEQEMLEKQRQEKRNDLLSLSDYWSEDKEESREDPSEAYELSNSKEKSGRDANTSLNSYRHMQSTLDGFYQDENAETTALRKQVEELKEQLVQQDAPAPLTMEDQLELMEKSYQMATRYLPSNSANIEDSKEDIAVDHTANSKAVVVPFQPSRETIVSALYQEPTDSVFSTSWHETRNRNFYTIGTNKKALQPKNSIKACVHETQVVTEETDVRLRLLEPAQTPQHIIPKGTLITANAKFQGGRLQLNINSIEWKGNIIPVEIVSYDLDGQQGLYVPYSPEMNALTEMAGNTSQNSGTNIMFTQSAGQQVAADLSRGVLQGVSGYFSKKIKVPKVTLKAGHQVLLVSK